MNADEIQAGRETVNFEVEFCKMVHAQGKNIVVEIFEKRLNRVAEVALQALDALSAAEQDRAAVRKEVLGWACAEMCQWCGIGIEVKQLKEEIMIHNRLYGPKGSWVHLDGETDKFLECHASPIRKLMEVAADADQGQPEELDSYTDKELKCTGCMGPCGRCDEADQGQAGKEG